MSFQVRITATQELRERCAKMLLRLANIFITAEKAEWMPGPVPSKPGEHLRAVTFNARDSLAYTPASIKEVAKTLEVRCGYRLEAWYAPWWELQNASRRRIGLLEKLEQFRKSGVMDGVMGSYES